jgi:hypothetical protein
MAFGASYLKVTGGALEYPYFLEKVIDILLHITS